MNPLKRYINPTFIAIFIIIIWDALKTYLELNAPIIQAAILLPAILLGILDNLNRKFWKTVFSPPAIFWLLWIIYALINTFLFVGYYSSTEYSSPLVFVSSIFVSFLLLLFIIVCKSDTEDLINVLIFAFFCRLMLSIIFDTIAPSGVDYIQRFGKDFNSNIIGIGALFLVILILLKKISYETLNILDYPMVLLALATAFLTASRKTYVALLVLAAGFLYIVRSRSLAKNMLLAAIAAFILFSSITWTLKNTAVGERFVYAYEKTLYAREVEKMFDHRAGYFINGWAIFKEHPINGIGLRNYPYFNKSSLVLHTEYMVQLTECGLIGVLLFSLFYFHIVKYLLLIRRKTEHFKKTAETHFVSLLVMFFLFLGVWIYNMPMMWVLIALAVRFIKGVSRLESKEYSQNILNPY